MCINRCQCRLNAARMNGPLFILTLLVLMSMYDGMKEYPVAKSFYSNFPDYKTNVQKSAKKAPRIASNVPTAYPSSQSSSTTSAFPGAAPSAHQVFQCNKRAFRSNETKNAKEKWTDAVHEYQSKTPAIITPENVLWSQNWNRYARSSCQVLPRDYLSVGKFTERKYGAEELSETLPQCTGGYVWIRLSSTSTSNVEVFANNVVSKMREPYTLITTDGDYSVPSQFPSYQAIMDSPLCTAWYTQNYDGTVAHSKIRPVPIGFDLHTAWPGLWNPLPKLQENLDQMLQLRRNALSPGNVRSEAVFVPPMATEKRHPDRMVAPKILDQCNITHDHGPSMPINELWENYTQYRFALSPFGNGLDTHRTWELLFFGVVPIVKTSSLDVLYVGLPVIIVEEYTDLCEEQYLETAWACVQRFWPAHDEIFTMHWWLEKRWNPDFLNSLL